MEHDTRLVFGIVQTVAGVEDDLVFAPDVRAENLAALRGAMEEAATWGQFRAMIALDDAEIIDRALLDSGRDPPPDDAPFEITPEIYCPDEMPWHRWLQGEMIDWVPQEIREEFGRVAGIGYQGNIIVLDPEREAEIVAKFEALGYSCERDDDLLQIAAGGYV